MGRRNYQQAGKGKLYAIEWPEWHVECAEPGCDENAVVSPLGMCTTLREAEALAARGGDCHSVENWKKRKGLWYCSAHAKAEGRS